MLKCGTGVNLKTEFTQAINTYNKNGELNTILNSHLMKNSEWGAIAFLSDSKYGRNGISISQKESENEYNGVIGQLSSTTGNIYGIYNMEGGASEYVMGFFKTEQNEIIYGQSGFTIETMPEKKYYQTYSINDGTTLGDGLYEFPTSKRKNFVTSSSPIFCRGFGNGASFSNKIFYSSGYHGGVNWGIGFRACLAVK